MLTNKKELLEIKNNLSELKELLTPVREGLNTSHQKHDSHSEILSNIDKNIENINTDNAKFMAKYEDELSKFINLNSQLQTRINSFKSFEVTAQKKLFEDVKNQFLTQIEGLSTTTKKYQELEKSLFLANKKIENLTQEIEKFKTIASEIKTADFELAKFSRQVTNEDSEKLRLMRENEKLKMLIAKQRSRH